jgi:hypothetical protein
MSIRARSCLTDLARQDFQQDPALCARTRKPRTRTSVAAFSCNLRTVQTLATHTYAYLLGDDFLHSHWHLFGDNLFHLHRRDPFDLN